jgi:hypothetical protein
VSELCFVMITEISVGGAVIFSLLTLTIFGEVSDCRTVPIRLRSDIPDYIANMLDQEKFITGKNKQQVMAEALQLYYERRKRDLKP